MIAASSVKKHSLKTLFGGLQGFFWEVQHAQHASRWFENQVLHQICLSELSKGRVATITEVRGLLAKGDLQLTRKQLFAGADILL